MIDFTQMANLRKIDDIQKAIQTFGVKVEYCKAMRCPCRKNERGEAKFYCERCLGDGWIWGNPIRKPDGELIRALISNRISEKSWEEFGVWESGTAFCTFPAGITPAEMDKVIPVDDAITINDEILLYGDKFPDDSSAEVLRYKKIIEVESIVTLNREYYPDKDFHLVGNRVQWIANLEYKQPYSVRYKAVPEYLIFKNQPQLRIDAVSEKPFFTRLMRLDKALPTRQQQ